MAPGAIGALAWGIVSLLGCGLFVGWVAIAFADRAKKAIRENPEFQGEGMANAGRVMGIIGIVMGVISLLDHFINPGGTGLF